MGKPLKPSSIVQISPTGSPSCLPRKDMMNLRVGKEVPAEAEPEYRLRDKL